MYSREDMVRDSIRRLVTLPDRHGIATQVIWCRTDEDGLYSSHSVTGLGKPEMYGLPTNRWLTARTVADCMILCNQI